MDILQILKKDHQTVKELFQKLETTSPRAAKTREKLCKQLKHDLEAHTNGEEQVFYASLKEHEEVEDKVEEAMEEHETVATLLEELEELDYDSEEWSSKLSEIKKSCFAPCKGRGRRNFQTSQKYFKQRATAENGKGI